MEIQLKKENVNDYIDYIRTSEISKWLSSSSGNNQRKSNSQSNKTVI